MKSKIIILFLFNILSSLSINLQGQSDTNILVKPERIVTKHTIKIDNKVINYTAVVGTLILKNEKDESIASIGYTAYTKDGEADLSKRPITYSYNGGPGSSSMWLHMGIMGPRRVVVNDPLPNGPAPYKIEDNNYSLLDISDIVMIDPVGTGLSRAVGKSKNSEFWGVDSDIKSVSQFIRDYTNENERWNSPKYLLGESYGTFRSAGVADYLQSRLGIALNGIVLVSNVLDIRTLSFNPGDDISYILNLPSYAAVAWYHNRISPKPSSLTDFLNEVRAFALKDYALALIQGDQLTPGDHDSMIKKLAGYTGLSTSYWAKANLRVNQPQFCQELLRDEGLIVGRLDARYTGVTQNLLSEYAFEDPQSSDISPAYISSFMHYFTTELKVGKDKKYNSSAYGLTGFDWDWKHKRSEGLFGDATSPNTGPDLIHAMSNNPRLKVLVLNGIYDLATPFGASEYTFDHLGLQPKIRSNISHKYYEAGHMMYVQSESASKFKKDVAEFILSSLK